MGVWHEMKAYHRQCSIDAVRGDLRHGTLIGGFPNSDRQPQGRER